MKKNITIIILIIVIAVVSLAFFIREGVNLSRINALQEAITKNHRSYEITLVDFISDYWKLYQDYQLFLSDYRGLAYEEINPGLRGENLQIKYREFEVTAYTSKECGTVTSTGIDLRSRYAKYLNIAAVDPDVIPYGSHLLIEFSDGRIKPFIAMDCGYEIKGNDIDIYMDDTDRAMEFGRQKLRVAVIK
jgi:3D (Asp-Asp-Asp) domain-containing protein